MSKAVHTTGLERIELERLRARVRRLFAILEETAEALTAEAPGAWVPPVDVCESATEVTVYVELPGVRAGQVEVGVATSHLRVAGRKKGAPRGSATHLRTERSYGEFARVVPLRWPVKAREATAELKDGLLTVRLPKLKDRRGAEFKVKVKTSAGDE
jgi:HSP20 family protein